MKGLPISVNSVVARLLHELDATSRFETEQSVVSMER